MSIDQLKKDMQRCMRIGPCTGCSREGVENCSMQIFKDAYTAIEEMAEQIAIMQESMDALKKRNEPMVMKLEDVKSFGWDYCYLEEERLPGKEYRSVCGDYALTCITWPCVASMRTLHGDDNYGKKWRCWTAKPTDEQRQAVKWDD